jgi:hypothetical protein
VPVDALALSHRVAAPEEQRALLCMRRRTTRSDACSGGAGNGNCGGGGGGSRGGGKEAGVDFPVGDGAYVWGLHLEGAQWDEAAGVLAEAAPQQALCALPPIHLQPVAQAPHSMPGGGCPTLAAGQASGAGCAGGISAGGAGGGVYECPLYKTSSRADFVTRLAMPIPPGCQADAWVLQGVAALCASDDG